MASRNEVHDYQLPPAPANWQWHLSRNEESETGDLILSLVYRPNSIHSINLAVGDIFIDDIERDSTPEDLQGWAEHILEAWDIKYGPLPHLKLGWCK